MTESLARPTLRVALIGNPNTGKSTLFTALAGVRQRIGNYPGVTVEKKIGRMSHGGQAFELIDLPGTYSLAPRSPDEMVAVDVLLGRQDSEKPDAVICIVDAGNLERNLYLVSQVLELGLPTIVALNMMDAARERGVEIDVPELSRRLKLPVVELQANRGVGVAALKDSLPNACAGAAPPSPNPFSETFADEVRRLEAAFNGGGREPMPRYLVERLLLDTSGYLIDRLAHDRRDQLGAQISESRARLAKAGQPVPAVEAMARYGWVGKLLDGVVRRETQRRETVSDRIDRVLTHRVWGTLAFALMMIVVFQAVFTWAGPLMDGIEGRQGDLTSWVEGVMSDGALRSLLTDGIIGGVGGVLVFLPQVLILFFFIGVLEDCGYMARAAYLMDKLMVRVGLSGKSFIPLLSSFACAIPGVMATRVIENRRDRFTTILIAPLMSCSARLPVYTLLIGAFIPKRTWLAGAINLQGLVLFGMYLVGIFTAVVVALVLKRTLLRGPTPPFVMELPSYKTPAPQIVFYRMLDRAWSFIYRAGTLIVAVSVLVWAALYFPHDEASVERAYASHRAQLTATIEQTPSDSAPHREAAAELQRLDDDELRGQWHDHEFKRQSYMGRVGRWIEPAVRPLGWDWRIGSAALASFPAREVVVATLSIIYDIDDNADEERKESDLQAALQGAVWEGTDRKVFGIPTALSIMVFFALCAQCAATLAVIKRETNSWRWPLFTFAYMTALAYLAAWATFAIASAWA